ncbi:MAG: DUF5689 domain-containing protein, partial [Bacteroidales bacterium]
MNLINKIKGMILMLAMVGLFASCDLEQDVAPAITYDGPPANCTIAEILAYHNSASDLYDSIPTGKIFTGIVISSDKDGNIYKTLYIQDSTGGIQLKVDNSALYNKYPIGQRVYIKCNGLVLGDYNNSYQLGWWENGKLSNIASTRENSVIFRDGMTGPEPAPIVITAENQVKPSYYNRLVLLKNCSFAEAGQPIGDGNTSGSSRLINLEGGGKITLRTSYYATFIHDLLPSGVGSVKGILTLYGNTKQLVIRSMDDLIGFSNTPIPTEQIVYSVDFSQNPLLNGWGTQVLNGAEWNYFANSSFKFFTITGQEGNNDSWLISPAINLSAFQNVKFSFDHKNIPNNSGNNEEMKVYYSTQYMGGAFNESEWTELPIPTFSYNFTTFTAS